jgi:PAS domain S-box-containing protein
MTKMDGVKPGTSGNLIADDPVKRSSLNILLVEDNPGDVVLIRELLKTSKVEFELTNSSFLKETKQLCIDSVFDVILLDLGLPDSQGLDTLRNIQNINSVPPVIVLTGLDDEETALASLREGAQDYLVKNTISTENILRAIKYGIERKNLQDLQKRHNLQFSVLSYTTTSLNECEDIPFLYSIICENITMLLDSANLASIEFEDTYRFRVSNIKWLEPWFEKLKKVTGLDLREPVFDIEDQTSEFLKLFSDEKLHRLTEGLINVLPYKVDINGYALIKKEIGINFIYAIGFVKNRNFYGGALIFSKKIISDDDIKLIETICFQASLSIHRRSIEKSLKIGEEKYRTVADFTYDWETWLSPEGRYIYVSPSCERITGYTVKEFMDDPLLPVKIAHPEDRELFQKHINEEIKGDVAGITFDYRLITRSGEEIWIGHSCQSILDQDGKWIGQRGSNRDITKRKKTETILLNSQKQLRALTHRMDEIAEEERIKIAREIHDELGHLLTALKYDIESLSNKPDLPAKKIREELEAVMSMVDALIDSVRTIASELRPGILDHLGLLPAIEWLIRQFQLRTRICCEYLPGKIKISFDKNETTIIFRILQEILTNVARHSKATNLKVSVNMIKDKFELSVTDNGVGFEMNDSYYSNSLGLMGMRERALSIGGEIRIDSEKGKGTSIKFLLMKK